jgi:membrane-anchored glycerophosphoryl diester phosphodiesterase (GDPDase)
MSIYHAQAVSCKFCLNLKAFQEGTLTFSIENANLMLSPSWASTKLINLVLSNTHFAYADFGLITFHHQADGYIPSLEWWSYIFTRVEE